MYKHYKHDFLLIPDDDDHYLRTCDATFKASASAVWLVVLAAISLAALYGLGRFVAG